MSLKDKEKRIFECSCYDGKDVREAVRELKSDLSTDILMKAENLTTTGLKILIDKMIDKRFGVWEE